VCVFYIAVATEHPPKTGKLEGMYTCGAVTPLTTILPCCRYT